MKKELVKGITMVTLVIVIALATAAVSANAQSANKVVSDVPFAFIVGDKTLAAGEYTLSTASSAGTAVLIQDENGKSEGMRQAFPISPKPNRGARLVFHKYGQRYFLAEIWTGGGEPGRQLTKSRHERAIERELGTLASKAEFSESTYKIVEVVAVAR